MNKPQYKKYPYQCKHPANRRECKPGCEHPKIITCRDCGAILLMVIGGQVAATATDVPLAARMFAEVEK